jgi:pyruvate dehydrogenase (quinone)
MVKLEMLVDGLPDFGTDHTPLNYAAIAQAAGIHSVRIEQPAEVRSALTEAFAHPGPALSTWSPSPTRCQYPRTSPRPR